MRRFCYKCGALEVEKGPLICGLCQSCFIAEHRLLSAPTKLELKICRRCHAYFVDGHWNESAGRLETIPETGARALVHSKLRVTQFIGDDEHFLPLEQVKGLKLKMKPRIEKNDVLIDVHACGKVHSLQREPHDERVLVRVGLNWDTCDTCNLRTAGYYEAIVQVRSAKNLSKEKLAEIRHLIQSCAIKAHECDRKAYIVKIDEKPRGPDFYVNPASLARQMARLLKSKFKAKLMETSKLVGRDRAGRKKFKVTVLAYLPSEAIK